MGKREGTITADVGNRRKGRAAKEGEWDKASYCTIIAAAAFLQLSAVLTG